MCVCVCMLILLSKMLLLGLRQTKHPIIIMVIVIFTADNCHLKFGLLPIAVTYHVNYHIGKNFTVLIL